MVARIIRSRTAARTAVFGLTLGLSALAALALWSTASTARTTASVRSIDKISDEWTQVFLHVSTEFEALSDYQRASSDVGREPLSSALGSAEPDLHWLEQHGNPQDAAAASAVQDTYDAYTLTLRQLIAAGSRRDARMVELEAEQAGLSASSLRKQAVANFVRKRLELNAYLGVVEQDNQRTRIAAGIISGVDLLFLTFCGMVLLSYQRRTERQAVESRHQALHDGLTGIANRSLLGDRMATALSGGGPVGLLLLDLNRFKEINDTLGHHYGDLLLIQVAERLSGVVRDNDTVARLGGDEFAVLLPEVGSPAETMKVAERILEALQRPAVLDGLTVDVSASIGAALYPLHSKTPLELLQHADIAMYAAKRGHLGVALYDPNADEHTSDRLTMLGELRAAIDHRELVLHYQPKLRTGSGEVCGVEALVRWQHPRRGFLGPGAFIPSAEESDLIVPLTEHVLGEALRQQRDWLAQGYMLPVAVNIATRCLLDAAFPDRVAALLREYGGEAGHLTLEITESAVITDPTRAREVLGELRDLGVRLSIDDFGTGYSSMAYLQNLPLDELKIDRGFITAMESSRGSAAIVTAVVELAHALDLQVVGEGVEDAGTLHRLFATGCDIAQGYHLCRPVPAAELTSWLADRARTAVPAAA